MSESAVLSVPHGRSRWVVFALALAFGLVLDQGTKALAFSQLSAAAPRYELTGFFAFTRAFNTGAAFGVMDGMQLVFMLVAVSAFVAIPYFVHTARRQPLGTGLVLGLILAGVCGNFWDRAVLGGVRDFLDFHAPPGRLRELCVATFGSYVWPTFNVADMCITGGASVVLGYQLFSGDPEQAREGEGPQPAPVASGAGGGA